MDAGDPVAEAEFDSVQTPPAEGSDAPPTPEVEPAREPAAEERTNVAADDKPTSAPPASETLSDSPAKPEIEIVPETTDETEPPRETLAGRWELLLCEFGADLRGLLLEVEKGEEGYTLAVIDDSQVMPGWKVTSSELDGQSASIQFNAREGMTVDFEGTLDEDGVVRGNVSFGGEGLELVRWIPSDRESLDGLNPRVPSVGVEKMQDFQPSSENPIADLREKARDLGDSALAYELCRRLSAVFRGQRPEEDSYSGFPEEYLAAAEPWGERIRARANLDIAYTMAICGYAPEEARKYLATASEEFDGNESESLGRTLAVSRGLIYLQSDDADEQQLGMQSLQEVRESDAFNTDATLGLAAHYERNDQPEKALDLYSVLAALPTGGGDMAPVLRLWDELGRDPAEVEGYLNEIYKEQVHQFADEKSDSPRAEGQQQTILGELFTGGSCPPCVAADIATGGLEITYPKSDLIMLRYHQHVPAPDPLTVAEGEERATGYYRVQGTPSLYFNGQPIQVVSMYGALENAPGGYADLRQIVDQLLTQSSELSIDLQASADGETISLSANVTGADEIPETWRLRLVLADDEVAYPARNGIRLHEMVVRAMPGGAEGIGPEDGKLQYEGTVSLKEVRQQIEEYVSQRPQLPMPPMESPQLHVVAFVQNDANRRVLQATSVPVEVSESVLNAMREARKAAEEGDQATEIQDENVSKTGDAPKETGGKDVVEEPAESLPESSDNE